MEYYNIIINENNILDHIKNELLSYYNFQFLYSYGYGNIFEYLDYNNTVFNKNLNKLIILLNHIINENYYFLNNQKKYFYCHKNCYYCCNNINNYSYLILTYVKKILFYNVDAIKMNYNFYGLNPYFENNLLKNEINQIILYNNKIYFQINYSLSSRLNITDLHNIILEYAGIQHIIKINKINKLEVYQKNFLMSNYWTQKIYFLILLALYYIEDMSLYNVKSFIRLIYSIINYKKYFNTQYNYIIKIN